MNRDDEPHEVTVLLTGPDGPLFLSEYAVDPQDTEGDNVLEEGPIHEGETTLTMHLLVDHDVSEGVRFPEEGAAAFPLADQPVSGCVRGLIEITNEGNADPSFRDDEIATDYC